MDKFRQMIDSYNGPEKLIVKKFKMNGKQAFNRLSKAYIRYNDLYVGKLSHSKGLSLATFDIYAPKDWNIEFGKFIPYEEIDNSNTSKSYDREFIRNNLTGYTNLSEKRIMIYTGAIHKRFDHLNENLKNFLIVSIVIHECRHAQQYQWLYEKSIKLNVNLFTKLDKINRKTHYNNQIQEIDANRVEYDDIWYPMELVFAELLR